jgi:ubiquinol-cytochrome c reductase cytochrome b subunit
MLFPVGLQPPADPMDTPAHVKPEWYFLALYQLLKFIPKTIGALIPVLLVLMLALWPFFDRKQDTKKATRIRLIAVTAGLILLIALTIWGEVS